MPRSPDGLLVSPTGKPAIGTLERLTAVALFATPGVPPESGGEYLGETKIRDADWNSQKTVTAAGSPIYVDEDGETWSEGPPSTVLTWRELLIELSSPAFAHALDSPVCVAEPYDDDAALLTGLQLCVADVNTQFADDQLLAGQLYLA